MNLQTIKLGEVCSFVYGYGLPESSRIGIQFPVYGSNGVVGRHNQAVTQGPAIVIGRKGSIGKVHFSNGPCWPIDTTYYVEKTKTACELTWLYYTLLALDLTKLNKSAAVPGLNRDDAYEQDIYYVQLPEQKRLAAILAKADRLRRLRRYALAVSDTYLQAVFLEMFDKEAAREWPRVTVAEVAEQRKNAVRTGPFGSQLLHSEFVNEGVAVLGIDNAVENSFTWKQARFITEAKYKQLERYRVFPDDLIITIMGTLGRCAVVPKNIPLSINTKHLCCITLDQKRCLPTYLHSCFIRHPDVLQQLGASERGAIMDGLNMGLIKDITVPLPPLPLQKKFAQIVQKHERLRAQQQEAARQADGLFQALLNRAFHGELTKEAALV